MTPNGNCAEQHETRASALTLRAERLQRGKRHTTSAALAWCDGHRLQPLTHTVHNTSLPVRSPFLPRSRVPSVALRPRAPEIPASAPCGSSDRARPRSPHSGSGASPLWKQRKEQCGKAAGRKRSDRFSGATVLRKPPRTGSQTWAGITAERHSQRESCGRAHTLRPEERTHHHTLYHTHEDV